MNMYHPQSEVMRHHVLLGENQHGRFLLSEVTWLLQ